MNKPKARAILKVLRRTQAEGLARVVGISRICSE